MKAGSQIGFHQRLGRFMSAFIFRKYLMVDGFTIGWFGLMGGIGVTIAAARLSTRR